MKQSPFSPERRVELADQCAEMKLDIGEHLQDPCSVCGEVDESRHGDDAVGVVADQVVLKCGSFSHDWVE